MKCVLWILREARSSASSWKYGGILSIGHYIIRYPGVRETLQSTQPWQVHTCWMAIRIRTASPPSHISWAHYSCLNFLKPCLTCVFWGEGLLKIAVSNRCMTWCLLVLFIHSSVFISWLNQSKLICHKLLAKWYTLTYWAQCRSLKAIYWWSLKDDFPLNFMLSKHLPRFPLIYRILVQKKQIYSVLIWFWPPQKI